MSRAGRGGAVLAAAAALGATLIGMARARDRGAETPAFIDVSGVIEAIEVDLRAEVPGAVVGTPFEEGSAVTAGAVVCELDAAKLRAAAAEAEAAVALEEARLREAGRELRLARDLARTGAAPRDAVERADNAVAIGQAAVEVARRRADRARLQLEDHRILAPCGGTLIDRLVEPGEFVPAGALVATLADLSRLHVKVYVREPDLGRVRRGTRALISVDAWPGRAFEGRVVRLARKAEFTPRSLQTREDRVKLVYETKVEVANPGGALLPGMPCDVRLVPAEGAP